MTNENLRDSNGMSANHPRRVETCDIDSIESKAIREFAEEWKKSGREIEAGRQEAGDYLYDIHTGVSVYETAEGYVADNGRGSSSRFENPRAATRIASKYLEYACREDDLPSNIEDCIEMLHDRGFGVTRGKTNHDTSAIFAERDETRIKIVSADDGQWWIMARGPSMPVLSEMCDRPRRVSQEAREWLDSNPDD